ncbi:VOC family protein [Zavarzinia sp. CC-PAN008]|uniref:VOC family protein n=1 Tax=Zavarzinia sp. CC-PAN008 TaxID=3243332 RepID=UPI003F74634E
MAASDIRYDRLGYVALNVSDLARSAAFYETVVGLTRVDAARSDQVLFRCTANHHDLLLQQGEVAGLKRLAWGMENAASLAAARAHFTALGLPIQDVAPAECAGLAVQAAFRTTEPNSGATFEYFCGMAAAAPFEPSHTKIARLGHVVLNVADRPAAEAFLTEQMNFRVSDRIEGAVSFLRCFPNPFHHSLGIGGGPRQGFHHVNFMVTEVDDIGKALWRCRKHEVPIVFGPGRHPPSESMFLYFLDPDGMTVEYSFGMEEFPEVDPRPPRLMPLGPQSVDYWGAVPDTRFASIGKIEPLGAGA